MVEHRNGLHHQKALDNFLDNWLNVKSVVLNL